MTKWKLQIFSWQTGKPMIGARRVRGVFTEANIRHQIFFWQAGKPTLGPTAKKETVRPRIDFSGSRCVKNLLPIFFERCLPIGPSFETSASPKLGPKRHLTVVDRKSTRLNSS